MTRRFPARRVPPATGKRAARLADPLIPATRRHMSSRRLLTWRLPLRATSGVFLLDSGLGKLVPSQEKAEHLQGFAAQTYPFAGKMEARLFTQLLGTGELATAASLLLPPVPSRVGGLGLSMFALGLLGLYLRTPGMRQEHSLRPTEQGLALAKDIWLFGIGAALAIGGEQGERGVR